MTRLVCLALVSCTVALPAYGFDAGTTHAGLTEGAALAARLGNILTDAYGRPLGLYEPLTLVVDGERGARIAARLDKLDPAAGYAPDHGRLPALSWLVAGAVAEEIPAERDRNHFFDPVTGRGLDQGGFLSGVGVRLAGVGDGSGSVRGLFSGASFDGTGSSAVAWLSDEKNDFALARFLDARERATSGATPLDRERGLADALLTAGALLHVIEDAADPAHTRGDYRVATADRKARFPRFVAARYGRVAVPAPSGPSQPLDHLSDAIHNGAGTGLADRTARRFFSDGTLPDSRRAPVPAVTAGPERHGYASAGGVRHLVAFERDRDGAIHWDLDERCFADYAAALLPDAGRSALSALDHLFRGDLAVTRAAVVNGALALGAGKVQVFGEDGSGRRRLVAERVLSGVGAGETLIDLQGLPEIATVRVAALFRGVDGRGEPIVIGGQSLK